MSLKKSQFADDEIPIFDEAVIYKRGDYWQMRMWLGKEHKYARFSLKTRNRDTAVDKAKKRYHELMAMELAGKSYFSLTTKQGVELYLEQRKKDIKAELITEGRYKTLVTHLNHWLKFIHKDTKLKELERTDCENYFLERRQTKKRNDIKISQSTIVNEQATINAMIGWLYRRNETFIDAFDFKKLKSIDSGDIALKRPIFTLEELAAINKVLKVYVHEPAEDENEKNNSTKSMCGYYLAISMLTGMRRGEMLGLQWSNISFKESDFEYKDPVTKKRVDAIILVTVPREISKIDRTRQFMVVDNDGYFYGLLYMAAKRLKYRGLPKKYDAKALKFIVRHASTLQAKIAKDLVFSIDGETELTPRAIYLHFENLIERAEIVDATERGIVPYSFRHSFITHKVNSGLDLMQISEMAGTRVTQIEKAYYRTTKDKMRENALTQVK